MVHGKPVFCHLAVQVAVANSGAFQLCPDGLGAAVRHVVLDSRVDEAAALAGLCHPVDGLNRGFWQNDVDAFAHGNEVNDLVYAVYTQGVCMSSDVNSLRVQLPVVTTLRLGV